MGSQQDLDQGGTAREWVSTYMGPSVGWQRAPRRNVLRVTAAGTYAINYSTSLVEVSVAGAVVIILPSAIDPTVAAGVLPGNYVKSPITIVDIGGNAAAFPITIQPFSVAENIMGLSSPNFITVNTNYGGYCLYPSNAQRGWNNPS